MHSPACMCAVQWDGTPPLLLVATIAAAAAMLLLLCCSLPRPTQGYCCCPDPHPVAAFAPWAAASAAAPTAHCVWMSLPSSLLMPGRLAGAPFCMWARSQAEPWAATSAETPPRSSM